MPTNNNRTLIVIIGLAALGLIMSLFAHFTSRFPGDLTVTLWFQSVDNQFLLTIMKAVSYAAGGWRAAVLVITAGIIVWHYLGRLEAGLVLLSGMIIPINDVFKSLIDRPRPAADLVSVLVATDGQSFPSGHAFFAMVVFGTLAYLAVTHQSGPKAKISTFLVFLVFILLIGASRVYLGAHWLSDVIGGYVVGAPFLVALSWLYRVIKTRRKAGNAG